jgi:hypothetical protein
VASLRDADLQLELSATESQKRILKAQHRLRALGRTPVEIEASP